MRTTYTLLLLVAVSLLGCNTPSSKYMANTGNIFGTYFSIKYESLNGENLLEDIQQELDRYTLIFSHYEKEATITKINKNIDVLPESEFLNCLKRSIEISEHTNGAFDITAAPLISAWGFGPEEREKMTQSKVDSLKAFTGYEKMTIENGKVVKQVPEMQLNMSAIAKGYACDLMGEFLTKKGCQNFMIDIGGEIVAKGKNGKGKTWSIGIKEPVENPFNQELSAALRLDNRAMATSGNYLNFYTVDGKKYAHTIDPKSGFPVQHSLLSATVVAPDCMTADAYATSFMVLGKDLGIEIARQVPGMEIYFIYADENGDNQVYMSEGFEALLLKLN